MGSVVVIVVAQGKASQARESVTFSPNLGDRLDHNLITYYGCSHQFK